MSPSTGDITPDIKRVRYEVNMRLVRRGKLALGIANGSVFAASQIADAISPTLISLARYTHAVRERGCVLSRPLTAIASEGCLFIHGEVRHVGLGGLV